MSSKKYREHKEEIITKISKSKSNCLILAQKLYNNTSTECEVEYSNLHKELGKLEDLITEYAMT